MNTNQIPIRGNVCTCSGVWFCYDIPESDPSRCPFCNRQIDSGEMYDEEDVQEQSEQGVLSDEIAMNINKAIGQTKVTLVAKVCDFCTNEIFFDEVDSPNAQWCPYCDGKLVEVEEFMKISGKGMPSNEENVEFEDELSAILGGNMGELVGELISVKFQSLNPFAKEKTCIFKGLDLATGMVKLKIEDQIVWVSLHNIKSLTVLSE